jgi:hypothetical protein
MNRKWNASMNRYIREHADGMSDEDLTENLRKMSTFPLTLTSVRKHRQRMKIKKEQGRGLCNVAKKT